MNKQQQLSVVMNIADDKNGAIKKTADNYVNQNKYTKNNVTNSNKRIVNKRLRYAWY